MGRLTWPSLALAAAIAAIACRTDDRPRIPDHLRDEVREESTCSPRLPVAPSTGYHFDERNGQPYPTPAGNRVEATIQVPLYPGSVEVDGFRTEDWNVQVFEVDATERELFGFFEKAMIDVDLVAGGFGRGDFGRYCGFVEYWEPGTRPPRAQSEHRVMVGTRVVDEGRGDSPNDYPGSTVVFAAPEHGKLVYYVLTER